jgi:translation initiation factor IF-3
MGPIERKPRIRINERIGVPQVRVVDAEGEQVGVMDTGEALALAREKGLDLIEVSPTARPPVCRIMDFGKFKYDEAKKQRAAKKKQHSFQIKEIKLRPKIEDHDYKFKVAAARKFLSQHHKVKLTIMFRGREMAHPELGGRLLERVIDELSSVGVTEHSPKLEGRNLTTLMAPRTSRSKPARSPRDSEATTEAASGEGSPRAQTSNPSNDRASTEAEEQPSQG